MANRQDSGSNSSHENQRPNAHNEDRLPEFTDVQGRGDDQDESEMDDLEDEDVEDQEDEGVR